MLRSSIPPEVKCAAIGIVFLLSWELFWWVIRFVAYTDKSIDELASGYHPKTGQKFVHCPPEVAEALMRSRESKK